MEFGGDLQAVGRLIDQLLLLHHRLRGTSSLSSRDEETLLQVSGVDRGSCVWLTRCFLFSISPHVVRPLLPLL